MSKKFYEIKYSKKEEINHDYLLSLLGYEPTTGIFTWKVKISEKSNVGKRAGCAIANGYRAIRVAGVMIREHHLAWFYVYQVWAPLLDHINSNRQDNSIGNLRIATSQENNRNSNLRSDNKTGYRGIIVTGQNYIASIYVDKVLHNLGKFDNIEQAFLVREAAEIEIFGEFRREITDIQLTHAELK